MSDASLQFADRIREAASRGTPLRLRGGGTKDFYGQGLEGDLLDTRVHAGILDYEPTELVITARAGTPLEDVERALLQAGQWLPFEPPHFGAGATLGGMVAAGLSGPGRASAGAVRDYLLGAKIMDGRGEGLSFGGRVMKNVAGYDVSRLLAGSLGTLGLVLEVSLKTLPLPACQRTLTLAMSERQALETMNRWGGKPLPITSTAWWDGKLSLRLAGAVAAVRAAEVQLGGEPMPESDAEVFWRSVREQTLPFFTPAGEEGSTLWRLSLPSVAPCIDLPGERFIEWGGALRWYRTAESPARVREVAAKAGGHATLFRGADKSCGAFAPLSAPIAAIHRRLKTTFDPAGVFNRGRMYADF
jgi:glycolate oxidase FAD binding subunit